MNESELRAYINRRVGETLINKGGYVMIRVPVNEYPKLRVPWVLQHRQVMERHLGRKLLSSESVHHKNGDKKDNRLVNLELWTRSQPPSQRASDLVKWAREIIDRYGAEDGGGGGRKPAR